MNEMKDVTRITPTVLGRPSWGRIVLGPGALKEHIQRVLALASELEQRGGGIVVLPHSASQETTARFFLQLLLPELRRAGQVLGVYQPQIDAYLPDKWLASMRIVVAHLPRCEGVLELIQSGNPQGQVVIASGIEEEWQQVTITIPHFRYSLFDESRKFEDETAEVVSADISLLREHKYLTDAYLLTAAFDAWGVPLPFKLLARSLQGDEDRLGEIIEEAQARDFLFWVEPLKPAALLVSTRSPSVARAVLAAVIEPESLGSIGDIYRKAIGIINPLDKSERYVAIKLFQAILRGGHYWSDTGWFIKVSHRRWLISLLETERDVIDTFVRHGDSIECLLWGKLFDELRLFPMSDRVFSSALERDKGNVFLLHARARMLGRWAQGERGKLDQAEAAFSAAARLAPDNPYVWQSWGVMHHELRNYSEARGLFRDALSRSTTGAEKVYAYVARANLELESGDNTFQTVDNLLTRAEQAAPIGSYVLVTRAKAAFYEGKYSSDDPAQKTAHGYLLQALDLNPANLAALNMMGNMALKRGHWGEAEKWLEQSLDIDPENIESLHSLAELEGERAELHLRLQSMEKALAHSDRSKQRLRHLINELGNTSLHTLVAFGVCLARQSKIETILRYQSAAVQSMGEAGQIFERALAIDPLNRWALHSRAMIMRERGEKGDAERLLMRILQQHPRNLASLISLATWKLEDGLEQEARMIVERIEKIAIEAQGSRIVLSQHEVIRALNACAALWVELKDVSRALDISERALEIDRENAYTLRARADILDFAGRTEDATVLRRRVQKLAGE